jgi:altronate hydrolase
MTIVSEYAVIVSPKDNLAVVKTTIPSGTELELPDGHSVRIADSIEPGHRFATRAIPAGEFVLQYGQPIGTSLGIEEGDAISHLNMSDAVPVVRDLPDDLHTSPPVYIPANERRRFMVSPSDGRVSTRNYLLIVPASMCASTESQQFRRSPSTLCSIAKDIPTSMESWLSP